MHGEEKGAIDGPAELPQRCTQSLAPRRASRHVDGDGHACHPALKVLVTHGARDPICVTETTIRFQVSRSHYCRTNVGKRK